MRVAIIGGGIAGLATAYELEQGRGTNQAAEYELFEAGPTLGGVISSSVVNGTVVERGPDSFLTEKPAAAELCRELGLGADLVASDDAQRKTFILVGERLVALPDGLMFLVPTKLVPTALSPLFSLGTKIRMGMELLHPPRPHSGDESVAALVKRHFGQEAVDRLADPLLSGIYGGDSVELSAQSVLPRLVEMETKYGSLTRGMLAGHAARVKAMKAAGKSAGPAKPLFTTLRGGLQQLIDALVARVDGDHVHRSCPVAGIQRVPAGWRLTGPGIGAGLGVFDGVILATPAWAAGQLLASVDPALGADLGAIAYSSSITVNLVYDERKLGALPEGFGFLVPAVEGRALLACTFVHRKFPGRTAPGKAVIRAFLGGARNAALLAEPDAALVEVGGDLKDYG
jgi:oxygen-dependent protoporphyrinogen oxidase